MKPSHLAQSATPRLFGLLLITILIGCAGGSPQVIGDDDDQPPPPMVKQPPAPKDGGGTAAGCDGVTEAGTCQDGSAVYCDVEAGTLRRKDCAALGKSCVLDPSTGAKCETVAPGGGGGESACETGVTNEGSCGGAGNMTATWCDEFSGETIVWDCAGDGLACRTDCTTSGGTPIPGAFCCAAPGGATQNECPALGLEGECNGTTEARWCYGDQLIEQQCTDGKQCVIDPVIGAICRLPEVSECDQLGFEGQCVGGKPRWCSGGEIMEVTCSVGTQCQEDGCDGAGGVEGAYCCSP